LLELFVLSFFFANFPSLFSPVKAVRALCYDFWFSSLLSTEPEADIPSCCLVSVHPNWAAVRGHRTRFFPSELLILDSEVLPLQSCPQARAKATFSLLVLFFRRSVFSFPFRLHAYSRNRLIWFGLSLSSDRSDPSLKIYFAPGVRLLSPFPDLFLR
jgi:hypothetical protein